jgi:hypothetical protein
MADINSMLSKAAQPNAMLPGPEEDYALLAAQQPAPTPAPVAPQPAGSILADNGVNPWNPPATVPTPSMLPTLSQDKMAAVTAASTDKKAQMATPYQMAAGGPTGSGTQNMSDYEADLRYMDASNLTKKYGSQATSMLLDRVAGQFEYQADASVPNRLGSDVTYDSLSSGLSGLGNALGGIAALGTGVVSNTGGATIAKALGDATEWVQGTQSPELQAARRVMEAKNFLDSRDTQIEFEKNKKTDGEFVASLKRVGHEVVNTLDNATDNSATVMDGISQALGSLFAVGPISKGIAALVPQSTKAGVGLAAAIDAASGSKSAARVLAAAGEHAPVLGSIAAIEGGGAYQQVTADIMGRDHQKLLDESPMYKELIDQGMSQEDAKATVANRTGKLAAAITAPLAAATGTLVSKFEGSPFAAKSLTQVVGNILKEPIEEGIQGGTSQIAQNYAEQQYADQTKALSEGVGRQVAEGALYGLGMTAVTQAPVGAAKVVGAAAPIVGRATLATAAKVGDSLAARADALQAKNEAASPVADATILKAATEAQTTAPQAAATLQEAVQALPAEKQPAAQTYVDKLMTASNFDPAEVSASLAPALEGSTNRVDAIQRLAKMVADAPEGSREQLTAGLNMYDLLAPFAKIVDSDPSAIDAIPANHPASNIIKEYDALMANVQNTPSVLKALGTIQEIVAKQAQAPVDVTNPEDVRNAATVAEMAPDKANLDNNEKILYQASQGNLQITPEQKAALQTSVAILRAAKAADEEAVRLGDQSKAAQVSRNVRTEEGEKGKSALQYAQGVMSAWKAGNTDLATDRLGAMKDFVQHMDNKVAALNTHFAGGDPKANAVTYQALAPNGEWFDSKKGLSVNPTKEGSVKFAQTVAMEAKMLADVYNGLADAFPDLGAKHFDVTSLDSKLNIPANQVVAASSPVAETPAIKPESTVAKPSAPAAPVKVVTPAPVEKVPAPAAKVEKAPVKETVAEPVKTGTAAAFPQLTTVTFAETFKLPTEQLTHTIGSEAPMDFVSNVLKSQTNLVNLVGNAKKQLTPEISKAYAAHLDMGRNLTDTMQSNLSKFLGENKLGERFAAGEEVNRFVAAKALNITETVDGEVVYNQELVEGAALAGLQWIITADSMGSKLDEKDVAGILGIDADLVTPAQLVDMNEGQSVVEAKRNLAQKIRNYWGVKSDSKAQIGNTEGIPESVAAELMRALESEGLIQTKTLYFTADGQLVSGEKPKGVVKTIDRIIPSKLSEESPIRAFPTAIEMAVMKTPEETSYIGSGQKIPVADTQMRNPLVQNTAQQKAAIEAEQSTPYYIQPRMSGLYAALGVDNLIRMFGVPDADEKTMNINHFKSVEGKNRSIIDGFSHLMGQIQQVSNVGDAEGTALDQTPLFYPHNMSRVGRMQMIGKYSPQANKMVREAILPTRSTLDLTNKTGTDYNNFMLGIAQALGVKVHKMTMADSRAKAEALLTGPLSQSVDNLRAWQKGFNADNVLSAADSIAPTTVGNLIQNFKGIGLTPMALHAVMEYSRMLDHPGKDFTTSIYVEADGMTNGPMNAMAMFTTGEFSSSQITNMAKGGFYVNRPDMTANEYNSTQDKKDLYQATTDSLRELMRNQQANFQANNPAANTQLNHLFNLMEEFLGGQLSVSETGDLVLDRGVAKNPLTITLYGAGAGGIAAKIVKQMTDSIYERLSQVAQTKADSKNWADAMFGPQSATPEEAKAKLTKFSQALAALGTQKARLDQKGNVVIEKADAGKPRTEFDPIKFTITPEEFKNMQSNVLALFVGPMREAITEVVGKPLLDTADLLRKATQVQSIYLEAAFRTEIENALAEKAKDPTWKKGDFLTQSELNDIYKKLDHLAPMIKTPNQTFYVAGSQTSDLNLTEFGRAFDGAFRTPAYVYGPANSGVSGIPYLNIGAGDANMMQIIASKEDAVKGTLKIFDGMNMPLDQMHEGSLQANEAVWQTWTANPLQAVSESYSQFMANANLDISESGKEMLVQALFPPKMWKEDVPMEDIRYAMEAMTGQLTTAVEQIEARHNVMNMVNVSVDQMAAVGVPYTRPGKVQLNGTDPASIAAQMNTLYAQELAKIQQAGKTVESVGPEIEALATKHSTGVSLLNSADLANLAQATRMSKDQADVLNQITKSLAAKEYMVVFGSAEQVGQFQQENGFTAPAQLPSGEIGGYTVPADRLVYLINPSSETLVHELIHAATFSNVEAHYSGDAAFARQNPQAVAAIKRSEALMNQFLELDLTQVSPAMVEAYDNATSVINDHLLNGNKAEALNEFMAWALSNRQLQDLTKRTKATKLAQIAQGVWEAIKSMFFRNREAPSKGTDMFSNLMFNTAMLMQRQPSTGARYQESVLFQNSQYGNNDRLVQVAETYGKTIAQYLGKPPTQGQILPSAGVQQALMKSYQVGQLFMSHGFNMDAQQASAFNHIVTALATEAHIDPNSMMAAQQLYSHVTKNLTVESFMTDPESTNPADRYYAQEKFNVIMGRYGAVNDLSGRSTLMPSFLALATVDDGFRKILSEMDLPKTSKNEAKTLDALLENTGNAVMDKLSARMAGTQKATNVQQAIDALHSQVADLVQNRETFIDQMASKSGGLVDRANEIVVDGLTTLSNAAMATATRVQKNASNRITRLAAGAVAGTAAILSQTNGEILSKGIMANINKTKAWEPLHTLINDLVGRTSDNANIYDMIKGTRSVIQSARQQFREHLPELLAEKFSRELTSDEWSTLHAGMGKTDLAALADTRTNEEVRNLLTDPAAMTAEISRLESELSKYDSISFPLVQKKAKQLANYMNTGVPGNNLLRNATAVGGLFGETKLLPFSVKGEKYTKSLDELISLYALDTLPKGTKEALGALAKGEAEGMDFSLSYLKGQRVEELRKTTGQAAANAYKGYIPKSNQEGVSLVVVDDSNYAEMAAKSYVRIGDYEGSSMDRGQPSKGYYFAPVAARASFQQGIMQNVRQTASGVDAVTGYTDGMVAGRITDAAQIKQMARLSSHETGAEPLLPVFDVKGNVVAYERSLNPVIMERTAAADQHLAKSIGEWRGRQSEEGMSQIFNEKLVDHLHDMYTKDIAESASNKAQYVNLFGGGLDPVLQDAVNLINPETRKYVENTFGSDFMVRRDMLNDALGYRTASIGDAWTGTTRWSPAVQKVVKDTAILAFGNSAYKTLVNAEKTLKNIVSDARVLIAVKSVIVPMVNLISNGLQLSARGVSVKDIAKGMPKKTAELESYVRSRVRQIELEAEMRATTDPIKTRRMETEVQSIQDANKRLSIWPLLEAGEFSTVADAGMTRSEMMLTSGKLQQYIEHAVNKLPGSAATLGRYALITKDTALFKALQKSVEYGDFLAKAVLYDDLVNRQGKSSKEALGRITEEFVNYDRLSGRFRGTLESMGLLWFYNFKIRSTKVGLSMIRNNPVNTLLATLTPGVITPLTMFGAPGLPTYDNLLTKVVNGTLTYSMGPGQGLRAPELNPWAQLLQ